MGNFDLKKYLAEGKLLKEEIMVDTTVMVDPNNTLMSNASDEEIDYIKANITNVPKMSVEDFIDIYDEYLDRFYDEADPLDGHIKALQIHIDKGVLTREEALEALAMLQGADVEDYEDEFLAENRLLKEELRDVEDILLKAGFRFDDGLLGGVGSGGAGYYDIVNDKIYGYNQSGPWNEEEFNKFYDNFEFNSNLYDSEDLEDLEISQPQLDKGIYAVGDDGYVEVSDNGDIEIYAIPQLSDEDGREFLPAFKMDDSGRAIPQYSKDEMRKILKDDRYYII